MNTLFCPLYVLAQATAPQSPEPQLLDIDGTLLVQFGLFMVLFVVLKKLLWQPFLRVKIERVTRVDGYRAEARRMDEEAAQRLTRLEADLTEARRQGAGERAVARAEAKAREATILAQAQAQAQRTLADAKGKLDATLASERATLKTRAAELGRLASGRILGRDTGPGAQA